MVNKRFIAIVTGLIAVAFAIAGGLNWLMSSPDRALQTDHSASPEAVRGSISGTARTSSGRNISSALVYLNGDQVTETDPNGSFRLEGLEMGAHKIEIQMPKSRSTGPPRSNHHEVTLSSDDSEAHLTSYFPAPTRLQGRVTAARDPVKGAAIDISYRESERPLNGDESFVLGNAATTGPKGEFQIEGLPPGRLVVLVNPPGHPLFQSRTIELSEGEAVEDLSFEIARSGRLKLEVVDVATGQPVAATVALKGPGTPRRGRRESTSNGTVEFEDLATGSHRVKIEAEGYLTEIVDNLSIQKETTVTRTVKIQPGNGLFGRVVAPDGSPVKNSYVMVRRDGNLIQVLKTQSNGIFEWPAAKKGQLQIRAISPRYQASSPYDAKIGRQTTLELGPGSFLQGFVVTEGGASIDSFRVAVAHFEPSGRGGFGARSFTPHSTSNADGAFEYGPIAPGRYYFRIETDRFSPRVFGPIEIPPDRKVSKTFRLQRGGTVQGKVINENGKPLSGARVRFAPRRRQNRSAKTVTTDSKGRFKIESIPPGRQDIHVRKKGYLPHVESGFQVHSSQTAVRTITLKPKTGPDQKFGFHGIGASLRKTDKGIELRNVMPKKPAARAGLEAGDVILGVDGTPVGQKRLKDVVKAIRGRAGKPVELRVKRPNGRTFSTRVVRDYVVVER